ncbi:hypothetical protein B566_EDAN001827 [Ephemera danica]|nr:hypothetical protein B566_EDAN001827 [Ephemera danica]
MTSALYARAVVVRPQLENMGALEPMANLAGNLPSHTKNHPADTRGRLSEFYRGRCVLITGATGFLGKVLVEKLLRTCPDVGHVFLLLRPKRGREADERFRELLANPILNRVRSEQPAQLSKLRLISGDVSRAGLGISEQDRTTLQNEVNVVLHSAATVRFDEPLKLAVNINTLGTRRVVEFARNLRHLHALVHVSTAYSNPDRKEIEEKVYPPPADPDTIIKLVQTTNPEVLDAIEQKLIGKHPNTYTFTKALAENIVLHEASDLPSAIVRPSIVTPAWQEPVPGWVDNTNGITGLAMEMGRGTLRSVFCDKTLNVNIIPVDVVVNAILAVAAHLHWHSWSEIPVYNVTSAGIILEDLKLNIMKTARHSPSKYVQWYPNVEYTTCLFLHRTYDTLLHYVPAFVLDLIMRVQGQKPIAMKIYDRIRKSVLTGQFFATNEFAFKNQGLRDLAASLHFKDRHRFAMDLNQLQWDKYVNTMVLGIRQYVLKDDFSSLAGARKKLELLLWGQRIVKGFGLLILLKALFRFLPQNLNIFQIFATLFSQKASLKL